MIFDTAMNPIVDAVITEPFIIGCAFKNTGNTISGEEIAASVYIENSTLKSNVLYTILDEQQRMTFTDVMYVGKGEYTISYLVDIFDKVIETDESNNRYERQITVGDQGVLGIDYTPQGPRQVCDFVGSTTYSVPKVPGAVNYSWRIEPEYFDKYYLKPNGDIDLYFYYLANQEYAISVAPVFVLGNVGEYSDPIAVTLVDHVSAGAITIDGDTQLCSGSTVSLSTSDNLFAEWSNGSLGNSIDVGAGTYYYVLGSGSCADTSESVTLRNPEIVYPSVNSDPEFLCGEVSAVLTADFRLNWQTGDYAKSIVVDKPGTYSYSFVDDACGTVSGEFKLNAGVEDAIEISANSQIICPGEELVLSANKTVVWSDGLVSQKHTISDAGVYTASEFGENDCPSEPDTIIISESQIPVDSEIELSGGALLVNVPSGVEVEWFVNGLEQSGGEHAVVEQGDIISAVLTDGYGCSVTIPETDYMSLLQTDIYQTYVDLLVRDLGTFYEISIGLLNASNYTVSSLNGRNTGLLSLAGNVLQIKKDVPKIVAFYHRGEFVASVLLQ